MNESKSSRWKRLIVIAPLAIAGMALFVAIGGQVVLHLWNWLLPPLFGFSRIGFWQALGLLALCRILFGSFGSSRSGGSRVRRRISERFSERMDGRCERMAPEERERFRQRMRERWGFEPAAGEGDERRP